MLRLMRKGQSTAEYAIVIGLVIAAAVAMQVYVKRGIQGKIKGAVDHSPDAMFTTTQYEPEYASSDMDSSRSSSESVQTKNGGAVDKNLANETSGRSGTQTTAAYTP